MSIKGTTHRLRGLDFNVLVEGEGPDVLLVHGFPDSNSVWRHQIPALVAGRLPRDRARPAGLRRLGHAAEHVRLQDRRVRRRPDRDPRCPGREREGAPRRPRLGCGRRVADVHAASGPDRPLRGPGRRSPDGVRARRHRAEAEGVLHPLLPDPVALGEGGLLRRLVALAADAALRRGAAHLEEGSLSPRPADRRDRHLPGEPRPDPAQGLAEGDRAGAGDLGRGRRRVGRGADDQVQGVRHVVVAGTSGCPVAPIGSNSRPRRR